jgi:hypothetical protein
MLARILREQNFSVLTLLHSWFCQNCLSDTSLTEPDDCCDELKDLRPQEAEHLIEDDIYTKRCFSQTNSLSSEAHQAWNPADVAKWAAELIYSPHCLGGSSRRVLPSSINTVSSYSHNCNSSPNCKLLIRQHELRLRNFHRNWLAKHINSTRC